ncbi:MAG: molybdenum cofactor biosynthesis protein MoaE [Planctomycetota bacterium]|nr:molybdenum cofactor biosynthesis protein MoaE [Planctomycetota bacterium]
MERITPSPIDEKPLLRQVEQPGSGVLLTFTGVVRDNHLDRRVQAIDYQGYEPMAEKEIRKIEEEIRQRWAETKTLIVHRLGRLEVGEASVVIAVSSPHRDEGFQALRQAIDSLKERVPIWKKEIYSDGYAWLEGS